MRRILAAFALVIVATAMTAPPCWACLCPGGGTKKGGAKSAEVIFTGKVVKIEQIDDFNLKTRFRLGKVYKGQAKRFTNVFTDTSCGYNFKDDRKYTVFALLYDGKKHTNICMETKEGSINPDNYGLPEGYAPRSS
jgi:hypothetical protein